MPYEKDISFEVGSPERTLATEVAYARPTGFRLAIDSLSYPNAEFNVQTASIPDITADAATMPLPYRDIGFSADKIIYAPLQITFLVDEELINYTEIHDWILGQVINNDGKSVRKTRDITLLIQSSHYNVVKEIKFIDAYPTTISTLQFDVRSTDMEYLTADVSFEYSYFKVD